MPICHSNRAGFVWPVLTCVGVRCAVPHEQLHARPLQNLQVH